eukprot:scaffold33598_cov64-Cyclotella_meneghiniana.AAC.1
MLNPNLAMTLRLQVFRLTIAATTTESTFTNVTSVSKQDITPDAAFCYDEVQTNTNGGSRVNFATEEQWQVARAEEINHKGLGSAAGTAFEIKNKISMYVKKETMTDGSLVSVS